jgi:hypothetical protein
MNPTKAELEEQIVQTKEALSVKLISYPFELVVLANHYEWERDYGMPAYKRSDGNVKTWFGEQSLEAVMPARNADDSWATEPNVDSVEGLQWTTRELSDFYKLYRSHFPVIPRFVLKTFAAEEVGRCQFGDGPAVDFPLARITRNDPTAHFRSTFPQNIAFRVKDGRLEWFKISEYKAAYPLTVTATLAPPVEVPDAVLLMSVSMVLGNSALTQAAKVAQLKQMFGVGSAAKYEIPYSQVL